MSAAVWIGATALTGGILVIALVTIGPLRVWGKHAIVTRRQHLVVLAVALTMPSCVSMAVSLAGRVKLNNEIRERADQDRASLLDRTLTRDEVQDIAMRTSRLEAPTEKDLIHLLAHVDEVCLSKQCKVRFARTVRNLLRIENGRIVPALPGAPPAARQPRMPAPPPRSRAPSVPTPPAPAPRPVPDARPDPRVEQLVREVAALERDIGELRERRPVNSALVDGLEDRVANMEQLAQLIVGRLDLLERLQRVLCRLTRCS